MIFSSLSFIFFFLFFLSLIKIFNKNQKSVIVLCSLFFYSYWNPIFFFLIIYLCLITFICYKKKYSIVLSSFFILLPLIYFKYSYFLLTNLGFNNSILAYNLELPLAISFITFTALAFIIDVKKKIIIEEISFFSFLEFIVYFPQLIAGPILRANELIPQLKKKIIFKKENIKLGIVLFTLGFIKKVYLADTIALIIDPIFLNPNEASFSDLLKGFLLFPFQIYFDFSGYIDMALGISKFFSINLPINFNSPYLSTSLTEFWRNWHITLSKWFRDYVYIPLGGSRGGNHILFINLVFTMSLAGLWHGSNFNFIIWGFINGLILFFEKKFFFLDKLSNFFKIFFTCFIIFNLWLIFRIQNLDILTDYIFLFYYNFFDIFKLNNFLLIFFVFLMIYSQRFDNFEFINKISKNIELKFFLPIAIIIIISGLSFAAGGSEKFIYFNF